MKHLVFLMASVGLVAQTPYLNPDLPAEQRAKDLVSRMTLDEKVLQMQNSAPAIARFGSALAANFAAERGAAVIEAWYGERRNRSGDRGNFGRSEQSRRATSCDVLSYSRLRTQRTAAGAQV